MQMKRVEFVLYLDDPEDEAIYRALKPSLRYRRAGAIIRQALTQHLVEPKVSPIQPSQPKESANHE